eukprot:9417540-Ditylum_brightwellii.AAC.1
MTSWKWMSTEQEAFKQAQKIVSQETLLVYPDFNISFNIYTDLSGTQLGMFISQCDMPITFYSYKLS